MAEFKGMLRLVGDSASLPAAVRVEVGEIQIRSSDTDLGTWPLSEVEVEERPDGFLMTVEDGQLLLTPFERSRFADVMTTEKRVADKSARKRRRRRRSDAPADSRASGKTRARRRPRKKKSERPRPSPSDVESPAPHESHSSPEAGPAKRRPTRRRRPRPDPSAPGAAVVESRAAPPAAPAISPDAGSAPAEEQPREGRLRRLAVRVAERLATSTRRERIVGGAVLAALLLAVFAAQVLTVLVLVGGGLITLLGIYAYIDDYVAVKIPAPWTPIRVMGLGLGVLAVGGAIPLLLL